MLLDGNIQKHETRSIVEKTAGRATVRCTKRSRRWAVSRRLL